MHILFYKNSVCMLWAADCILLYIFSLILTRWPAGRFVIPQAWTLILTHNNKVSELFLQKYVFEKWVQKQFSCDVTVLSFIPWDFQQSFHSETRRMHTFFFSFHLNIWTFEPQRKHKYKHNSSKIHGSNKTSKISLYRFLFFVILHTVYLRACELWTVIESQ